MPFVSRYSSSVECDLPKVERWVRFPLPALSDRGTQLPLSFFVFFISCRLKSGNQGRLLFPLFAEQKWESGTVPFPAFCRAKMGIRDGSFSHFLQSKKWEKEPSLIPIFLLPEKQEKEVPCFSAFHLLFLRPFSVFRFRVIISPVKELLYILGRFGVLTVLVRLLIDIGIFLRIHKSISD